MVRCEGEGSLESRSRERVWRGKRRAEERGVEREEQAARQRAPPLPCRSRAMSTPQNRCCFLARVYFAFKKKKHDEKRREQRRNEAEAGKGRGKREREGKQQRQQQQQQAPPSLDTRKRCSCSRVKSSWARARRRPMSGRERASLAPETTGDALSCLLLSLFSLRILALVADEKNREPFAIPEEMQPFSFRRCSRYPKITTYLICTTSSRPAMGAVGLPVTRGCGKRWK